MGTLPALSILKGRLDQLRYKDEPILLHRIFEHTLQSIDSINNNNDKIATIHGITLREGEPEIIFGKGKTTLGCLNEEANQIARAIQRTFASNSNSDGDTVIAVDLPPSPQLVTALLAIWKLNAAYLPLDAAFPDQRVQHILKESRPVVVITDKASNANRYAGTKSITYAELKDEGQILSIENISEDISWAQRVSEENQIAIILYTSGSTGVPKGVRLPHRVILNRLKWQWKYLPYSSTENVCLFKTALTFVDSVPELWGPLLWGRSILILPKKAIIDTEAFINALDTFKIERVVLVPTLLQSILLYIGMVNNEKTPFRTTDAVQTNNHLKNLKLCISSGETLSVSLAQKFYQYFPANKHTLLNLYGSTEVMGDVLFHPVQNVGVLSPSDKIPIGLPLDNTNIYILDKQFRPVQLGEVGELFASGLNVSAGYVNGRDPERFIDNPLAVDASHMKMYRTGDYARIEKGLVYYEGRTDSQIKVRGHKVDLSEVEAAVAKVDEVDKAVILCYKTGQIDQALLAFATGNRDGILDREVEEKLEKLVPPYMVPQVVILPSIPLLVNGKVDRQFLLKQYEESVKENPCSETNFDYTGISSGNISKAKALFETIAVTLGRSLKGKINANSNYYHLGGNSLNSVLAVTKLRDLGFAISIAEFITSNSLMEVVLRMHEEEATVGVSLNSLSQIPDGKYSTEILAEKHKQNTISIITASFYEKAELESFLAPNIQKEAYTELIEGWWECLMQQKLSFAVLDAEGEVIAVSLNMDANAEPDVEITSKLTVIFEFLEYLEAPFRDNFLPKGTGQVFHGAMMGTAAEVSTQQNIELMLFMEHENLKLARARGFAGIFTTNTSPLTQQLGTDVFEYHVLNDYQINKYVATDGTKPFGKASNSDRAIVSWKPVD